ncbi:MAG: hypothetical protein ACRD9Q_09935, partial [Nitrososphaeraceae archaeon]
MYNVIDKELKMIENTIIVDASQTGVHKAWWGMWSYIQSLKGYNILNAMSWEDVISQIKPCKKIQIWGDGAPGQPYLGNIRMHNSHLRA